MEMQENESWERFNEGMKRAVARARQLGHAQQSIQWEKVAKMLEGIRTKGEIMYASKALSRQQVLANLDRREEKIRTH